MIGALVIIRNEEALIERCLSSLKKAGEVGEIVVIHDGDCADQSLQIARRFTQKVFEAPLKGMMEYHLIEGLEHCTGDWVLRVDADEFLSDEMAECLSELVKNKECDAFSFVWPLWDGKKALTKKWPHKRTLFRKSAISYVEFPHRNFILKGPEMCMDYILHHQPPYNNYSLAVIRDKQRKWINIHARAFFQDLHNIRIFNQPKKRELDKIKLIKSHPSLLVLTCTQSLIKNMLRGRFLDIRGFLNLYFQQYYYYFGLAKEINNLKKGEHKKA